MTTATLLHPVGVVSTGATVNPHELAAWLEEVRPVAAALSAGSAQASSGQTRWIVEQSLLADDAMDALDHAMGEADADPDAAPLDELAWLHTQVSAVAASLDRLLSRPSAAA